MYLKINNKFDKPDKVELTRRCRWLIGSTIVIFFRTYCEKNFILNVGFTNNIYLHCRLTEGRSLNVVLLGLVEVVVVVVDVDIQVGSLRDFSSELIVSDSFYKLD